MNSKRLEGASTITQQVAKNFLLTNEVSLQRKLKEAILAFRIERSLSKERILELYLNQIYLGQGSYGIAAASLEYFDKSIDELNYEEAALLAALPKAPSRYNPYKNKKIAKFRRDLVLKNLLENKHINEKMFKDLKNTNPTNIADLHNVLRTQFLKFLFQLSFHKVVSVDKKRSERKALTRKKNKIFKPLTSIHFNYQEVFNKLGFDIDLTKDHSFPAAKNFSLNTEAISLTNRRIIGIAPFARYLTKTYPLDLMQKVVGFLDQKYTVFLFGFGKFEMDIIEKWSKVFKNVYSSSSLGGFENEIALISNLDLMISMDSAYGHIASIYNVPDITLWGLTHPYTGFTTFNTCPDNQLCVDREKYPLVPNSIYGNKELKGYEDAMRSINYNDVLARAESILNNRVQK